MISFDCPSCSRTVQVEDALSGKDGTCPACGEPARFPEAVSATLLPLTVTLVPSVPRPTAHDARAPAGYEVLEELGRGGMGVVYKARQVALNRVVALKMILSGAHAGEDETARFRTEAEAIARLQHPGIVQVFDVGEHDGRPFFALEFCAGGSLEKKLGGVPTPPREAAAVVRALAEAVQAAHDANVIHRDLKPGNVLLSHPAADAAGSPSPKVTDFGLAKKLDEQGQTVSGAVMGTPSYMAPEQARGEKVGPLADVYALGAILYECLTGRPPFRAATAFETMAQVIADEPVAPRRLNAAVPRDLETVALKCLDKSPAGRYASARELGDDLGRFLGGEPVRARPVGSSERAAKWVRRNKAVSALAAGVFLTMALGAAASGWFAWDASREAKAALGAKADALTQKGRADEKATAAAKAEASALAQKARADERADAATRAEKQAADDAEAATQARAEAERREKAEAEAKGEALRAKRRADDSAKEAKWQRAKAEEQLRRVEWLVYAGKLSLAQSAFAENDYGLARRLLDDCQWDLRGWEHRHLWTRFDGKVTLRGHELEVTGVAWSPDGTRVLTGGEDRTARIWDVEKGTRLRSLWHEDAVNAVAWSPDGARVVTACDDKTARVWDARSGKEVLALKGHADKVAAVAWSRDGKRILTGSHDKTARLWDAAKGAEVWSLKLDVAAVTAVALGPDGRRAAAADGAAAFGSKAVKLIDAEKGELLRAAEAPSRAVAFGPDGRLLLAGGRGGAALLDAETGAEVLAVKQDVSVDAVAFAPDGRAFVTADADGVARVRDAATGRGLAAPRGHTGGARGVAYAPDGRRIATAGRDGLAQLCDAETGAVLAFETPGDPVVAVEFSPDGQRVFTGNFGGAAREWDARTGAARATIGKPAPNELLWRKAAWSPEGDRFVTAGNDGMVRVWDAVKGVERAALAGHTGPVLGVAFGPGGRVASAGIDAKVKVWDADKGKPLHDLAGHRSFAAAVAFSADGKRLLSASADRTAKLWDAEKGGEALLTLRGHTDAVLGVAFGPGGKLLLTAGADGSARVWDAAEGGERLVLRGHVGAVNAVTLCPDGRRVLTGGDDKTARLWDAASGAEVFALKGHRGRVTAAAWGRDARRVLTGSLDGTARLWDAERGPEDLVLRGHAGDVKAVAFSDDGKRVATASEDRTARLWDAVKGVELIRLKHDREVTAVAVSPDGRRVATGCMDRKVRVWDAQAGGALFSPDAFDGPATAVAFSADGAHVYAWDERDKVLAWWANFGQKAEPRDPPRRQKGFGGAARSRDDRLTARPSGREVLVSDGKDRQSWPLPNEAERKAYHEERAAAAKQAGQHFAAAFHLGRLLLDAPGDEGLKKRRDEAMKRHAGK